MKVEPGDLAGLPSLIRVETLWSWLPGIFPEGIAHRNYVIREMAAKTIFVMLYTGAVEGRARWFRPAQATLMTDDQAAKTTQAAREKWASDSLIAGRIKGSAGCWYAANSREPIRDETLRNGLIPLGAVIERPGIPTTSGLPRYALSAEFCELLEGLARGQDSGQLVAKWQKAHLTAEAFARVRLLKTGASAGLHGHRIKIDFPNGETRLMLYGPSAVITKVVIETFAVRFLAEPAVLFISDSGEKVVARDEALAEQIGLHLEIDRNLPDIILVDVRRGHEKLVFVEVVATDGAITSMRKKALGQLASNAKFSPESVYFVTAFRDRSAPAFRKLAADLAWDSFVWFASEPANLVYFRADAHF